MHTYKLAALKIIYVEYQFFMKYYHNTIINNIHAHTKTYDTYTYIHTHEMTKMNMAAKEILRKLFRRKCDYKAYRYHI